MTKEYEDFFRVLYDRLAALEAKVEKEIEKFSEIDYELGNNGDELQPDFNEDGRQDR